MEYNKKRYTKLDGDYAFLSMQCSSCIHLKKWDDPSICEAFPNGIPADIWNDEVSHMNPFQGDQGIQYEEKEYDFSEKEMQELMDDFIEDV